MKSTKLCYASFAAATSCVHLKDYSITYPMMIYMLWCWKYISLVYIYILYEGCDMKRLEIAIIQKDSTRYLTI